MNNIVSLCLSIIAIIIAIISLCSACPRTNPLDFDYLGLLIGILSVLVTALLGWQIFSVISVEERLKKLSDLYGTISTKSAEIEDRLERDKCYLRGLINLSENTMYFREEIKSENSTLATFENAYIRFIEDFKLLVQSGDNRYPALCLIKADEALTEISKRIKAGEKQSTAFNDICDRIYNEAIPIVLEEKSKDISFFHEIRARRKSLNTEHHNPPATNPWGIRISPNRVPMQ